jgi:hypothetical protein
MAASFSVICLGGRNPGRQPRGTAQQNEANNRLRSGIIPHTSKNHKIRQFEFCAGMDR